MNVLNRIYRACLKKKEKLNQKKKVIDFQKKCANFTVNKIKNENKIIIIV